MFDKKYAHVKEDMKQNLFTHLENTAKEAKKIGDRVGLGQTSYLLGLVHDLGKISESFQDMILNDKNTRVDHSSLGGLVVIKILDDFTRSHESACWADLYELIKTDSDISVEVQNYTNILIYASMSHHGQYDMVRKNSDFEYTYTSLERIKRIEKIYGENSDKTFKNLIEAFKTKNISLIDLYKKGFYEYIEIIRKLNESLKKYSDNKEARWFYKSMLIRLLVSILKSADIKDTINAFGNISYEASDEEISDVIKDFEEKINNKYLSFGEPKNELNRLRGKLAHDILHRSKNDETGIYELKLPTGAGKTLLSLRYGINQLRYKNKERFFYVTSYLSVLEQNANTMREVLANDKYLLEHHSNIVSEDENECEIDKIRKKFLLDDWSLPVVMTTTVQFYNTIFKGKSSNLTRFKSLINSVIILDEWQSIPTEFLYLTNLALNFLKIVMNATVVLSTATQPTNQDESLDHRLFYGDNSGSNRDLIKLSKDEGKVFKRVDLKVYGNINRQYSLDEVGDFINTRDEKSKLIILNTKSAVKKLYEILSKSFDEADLYYLTTNLTADDRLEKIEEIKKRLKKGDEICVISTQLIEAGVDVDFSFVLRSISGMDSVVQAMGRCNREAKKDRAFTYLVRIAKDEENTSMLKGIDEKKKASEYVLRKNPIDQDLDILVEKYYKKLYSNLASDEYSDILTLLSDNYPSYDLLNKASNPNFQSLGRLKLYARNEQILLTLFQSFKKAYESFDLIDNKFKTGVVSYRKSEKSLNKIRDLHEEFKKTYDFDMVRKIREEVRKLSRHTVPISKKYEDKCEKYLDEEILIVPSIYYSKKFGLDFENQEDLIL